MSCADAYASATEILLIYTFLDLYLIYLNEHDIDARYYAMWDVYIQVTGAVVQLLNNWCNHFAVCCI